MTIPYKSVVLPLTGGLDQSAPSLVGKADDGFNSAVNVDYGYKGELRGRPSYQALDGFASRGLTSAGAPAADAGLTPWANLPASAKVNPQVYRVRDARGERAAVGSQGHAWTWEDGRWVDRLHFASARALRLCEWFGGRSLDNGTNIQPAAGVSLGPVNDQNSANAWGILGSGGTVEYHQTATAAHGPGTSAVNSAGLEAVVTVDGNNLRMITATAGSPTLGSFTLATDAQTPAGFGDCPVICADYDSAAFFVVYATTTAHTVKVLKVNSSGTITANTSFTYGTGTITGVWVCNSKIATDKVLVTAVDSVSTPVFTTVRHQTNLTSYGIDITPGINGSAGPVVCGCADQANAWLVYKDGSGMVTVATRSMTAASAQFVMTFVGTAHGTSAATLIDSTSPGRGIWISHQPVDINGRVVIGLAVASGWQGLNYNVQGNEAPVTWFELDFTDVWQNGTTAGTRLRPTMLAQGPRDGSMIPLNPVSASVFRSFGSAFLYRFTSIDYRQFTSGGATIGTGTGPYFVTLPVLGIGGTGSIGVNEIQVGPADPGSCDYAGESTLFSGSVPHEYSRGYVHEVGFPWSRPAFTVTLGGGGSVANDTYVAYGVWSWVDEAGQTHRSEPVGPVTWVQGANTSITFHADGPVTEREYDQVYFEAYVTINTAVGTGFHYLQGRTAVTQRDGGSIGINPVSITLGFTPSSAGIVLYTDGGALTNFTPRADGGVVTLGRRTWISDGSKLYASQIPQAGFAATWNNAGPLVVHLPATAGRVVALSGVDDKVIALCEHGIYVITGQGPNNLGVGSSFSDPYKVSDLGVHQCRAVVSIPGTGVVFYGGNTSAFDDGGFGGGAYAGLYKIDRAMSVTRVSWPAQGALEDGIWDVAYSANRNALFVNTQQAGMVVWDVRAGLWATWNPPEGLPVSCTTVDGQLYTLATTPASYSGVPGTDSLSTGSAAYAMLFTTNNLFANGTDGLGWARVRSVRVLGELAANSLTYSAILDQWINLTTTFTVTVPGGTTWPTTRAAPEWRLPQQKASSVQVTVSATPATAAWTALELQILPLGRAPANQRG